MDALVHTCVEGTSDTPPASPTEGDTWLVTPSAQGDWAGFEHHIAIYRGGAWNFIGPKPGMRIFDNGLGQFWLFDTQWTAANLPGAPQGGANIDPEARAAIVEVIQALTGAGILPRN